jgi:hypothetical protein
MCSNKSRQFILDSTIDSVSIRPICVPAKVQNKAFAGALKTKRAYKSMSRGLGVMERAVASCIAQRKQRSAREDAFYAATGGEPPKKIVNVSAWDVCMHINQPVIRSLDWKRPTEAQLKAAKRAMHSFVRKFPEYGLMTGKGRGGKLWLYGRGDKLTAMWAKLKSQSGRHVTLGDAHAALAHVEERRNEPFRVKKTRYIEYRKGGLALTDRRPQVFKDLDLTNA